MAPTVKLAEYLFTRLHQLGVRTVFGVPGDYQLTLLDYIEPAGLHWTGTCNELNAGYSADAYSRIKGLGALVTTFGVGELSAINAIAGAYAERAPVVHIVGTPVRASQDSRALVHHTFNDGDYTRFSQMYVHVTVAQVSLRDPRTSPAQIDWALEQCLLHSRPVYIDIPVDLVPIPVPSARLETPVSISPTNQPLDEEAALSLVLDRIYSSKTPMIFVDGEIRAFWCVDEVNQLVKATQWPTWTTVFSKGLLDETVPNVNGIWTGSYSRKEIKDYIDSCDLVLCFGPHYSNTNSYAYSSIPSPKVTITFTTTEIRAGSTIFRDLPTKYFMSRLLERLEDSKIPAKTLRPELHENYGRGEEPKLSGAEPVKHDKMWRQLSRFVQPGDIVLAETGTAAHGTREFALPQHARYFSAVTWLSIGYMLPATLGAALAQRELVQENKWNGLNEGRTVLFIGDGSLQMTVQAISDIIQEKLNIIIFIINNDGYTIERCIHGRNQTYNDVARWNYLLAPAFFGAEEKGDYPARTYTVKTYGDLDHVMNDEGIKDSKSLRVVEVMMERMDAPVTLHFLLNKQLEREKAEGKSA